MATKISIMVIASFLLAADAARPMDGTPTGRELLGKNTWGKPAACPGAIGFGGYKAVVLPQHELVAGNIQFYNRGPTPFNIRSAGFVLGPKPAFRAFGPIKGGLHCPKAFIPAGGALTCGFVTPAEQPLAYSAFKPYFVPVNAQAPCFCQQQLPVMPFTPAVPAAANPSAPPKFNNAQASALATSLAQAWSTGPSFSFPAVPSWPAWNGNPAAFANSLCSTWFTSSLASFGPASSQAVSNAESFNGDAAADANVIAQGTLSDANGAANSIAHNGAATASSNTAAKALGGPAAATSKAAATGTIGAKATGSGQAVALGGPAISQSGANALTKCGSAFAGNQAGALSSNAAIAAGVGNAGSGCGPATAISGTSAVVVPKGPVVVGPAMASDKATAAGSAADAKSTATAINGGIGPAIADAMAAAQGRFESSAAARSQAIANNGPAIARSSAISG